MTAKVCVLARALRNTRFVKSADPDPQHNQALRPSFPRAPGGSVTRSDRRPEHSPATTARKLLINLTVMADGHFARLRGHWARSYVRLQGFWAKQFSSGPCRSVRGDDIQLHGMGDGALRRRSIKLLSAGWLPHSVFRPGASPV